MIRKIVSGAIALIMLWTTIGVTASDLKLDYWPGDGEIIVDSTDYVGPADAIVEDGGVAISAGSSATYEFYAPFNMRSVKIVCDETATLTISSDVDVYEFDISPDSENVLEFGANLKREPYSYDVNKAGDYFVKREHVELEGERSFVISSDADVIIDQLIFEKEKLVIVDNKYVPAVSNEELKTMATVFMDVEAPVIFVTGGARYIDIDDRDMIPYELNGSIYIPIETLAKALGYYYEDDPSRNYALMRSESHEYVMFNNEVTVSKGLSEPVSIPESEKNAIIYRNGKTLAGVRYFAELAGKTVGYQDGLVVIDNKFTVNDVLTDFAMNSYAKGLFKEFKAAKTVGTTYYVAQKSSSVESKGTQEAPFKTIQEAADIVKPGDTVIIKEGTYRETLIPNQSGTATAPITFRAAEGENVVISATEVLSDVEYYDVKDNQTIYVAPMSAEVIDRGDGRNQIFIDGKMMTEARYPNGPSIVSEEGMLDNAWPVRGNFYRPIGSPDKVESDTLLNDGVDWQGGYYVGLFGKAYTLCTAKIKSSKAGELTLYTIKGSEVANKFFWDAEESSHFNWGYIVGHKNALDIPGEWYYEKEANGGTLYIILPEGKTPETTTIEAKARDLVIDLANKDYIHIEGIETIGGSARMNESKMCVLNRMDMKYISHYTHGADQRDGYIDFPREIKVNGAPQQGRVGIYISGKSNVIANSVLDHSAGCGVYLTGLYTQIDNNIIKDCGYMGSYVSGIHMDTLAGETHTTPRGGHGIYSNTVYNCGRSCWNISVLEEVSIGTVNHLGYTYLPIETAYNDFHDGILTSADTGIVYQYYSTHGTDYKSSSLHHNYVYQTTNKKDNNPYACAIYWDAQAAGIDTYENVIFLKEEGSYYSLDHIFEQILTSAPASNRVWGNHKLGYIPEDVDNLPQEYFTEEKPFYAGSTLNLESFDSNYNRFANNEYQPKALAREATELSDGVNINDESGYAEFTADGQSITFNDVDFGEDGSNALAISFRGNSGYTGDIIEITIDSENPTSYTVPIEALAKTYEQSDTKRVLIAKTKGIHDVVVKTKKYYSVSIGSVCPYTVDLDFGEEGYAHFAFAGGFERQVKFDETATDTSVSTCIKATMNPIAPALKNTWGGYQLEYENQVITAPTSNFAISIGSGGVWANQPIEVYINDEDEPIITVTVDSQSWNDFTPKVYPLNRTLMPGTYKMTLRFRDKGKSSNFRYFGFIDDNAELPLNKHFGSDVNVEASTLGDVNRALVTSYMDPPEYFAKGLMYTLPGTTLVFDDVKLHYEGKNFVMRYSADENYDDQPVKVEVKDANDTIVASCTFKTTGTGSENFIQHTEELDRTLPVGTYTVYITYGGDATLKQTSQLLWFAFK